MIDVFGYCNWKCSKGGNDYSYTLDMSYSEWRERQENGGGDKAQQQDSLIDRQKKEVDSIMKNSSLNDIDGDESTDVSEEKVGGGDADGNTSEHHDVGNEKDCNHSGGEDGEETITAQTSSSQSKEDELNGSMHSQQKQQVQQQEEHVCFVDAKGNTALHLACRRDPPLPAVRALLALHPRSVWMTTHDGSVPLHLACHCGCEVDVASELLDAMEATYGDRDEKTRGRENGGGSATRIHSKTVASRETRRRQLPMTSAIPCCRETCGVAPPSTWPARRRAILAGGPI